MFIGRKSFEYYRGLLIKADTGLHEQVAAKVRSLVPVGSRVLDFGAGEGALSMRMVDSGYEVTAVDMNAENFKCAQAQFSELNFDVPAELETFVNAHHEKFDVILSVEVVEHIENQWAYIRQLFSMLRPGGIVVVTTPNITSWLSRGLFLLTGRFHQFLDEDLSYGHIAPVSQWELRLMLQRAGGQDIEISPGGVLPAIYLPAFNRVALWSLLHLAFRPFMRGHLDGWCLIATARKLDQAN